MSNNQQKGIPKTKNISSQESKIMLKEKERIKKPMLSISIVSLMCYIPFRMSLVNFETARNISKKILFIIKMKVKRLFQCFENTS